jgi:membrane-bound ClpP family serine protease
MNEAYAFTIILIAAAVIAVIAFIVGVIVKYKQNKENANKKKVYISDLVITYCGVGTALMNKRTISYRDATAEGALKSRQKQQEMANKAHQTLASLSDTDIFNFEGIVVIHKNQFIAIEQGTYMEYE